MELTRQQKLILGALPIIYLIGRRKGRKNPVPHLTTDEVLEFHELLLELMDDGMSIDDIADQTNVPSTTIMAFLKEAAKQGLRVEPNRYHIVVEHKYPQ